MPRRVLRLAYDLLQASDELAELDYHDVVYNINLLSQPTTQDSLQSYLYHFRFIRDQPVLFLLWVCIR